MWKEGFGQVLSELEEKFNVLFEKVVLKNDMNFIHQANGLKRKMEEQKEIGHSIDDLKKR